MIAAIQKLVVDTMSRPALRIRMILLGVLGLFSVYFGFFALSAHDSVNFIKNTGYYFMMAAFIMAGMETYLAARKNWGELWPWMKHHYRWPFFTMLGILTFFLWVSQEVGYKILMDEVNLLGTSMYLHTDNKAMSVLRGFELNGVFLPLGGFIDKRPLFYPFLVSLLHDVFGYRPANAFYLNLALIPVGLTLTYTIALLMTNVRGGILAMLLLASFPMFNQCAHGGGFEVLNVVMILTTLLSGMLYLRRPESSLLSVFCLSTVLLANVRYESVLFVFPVAILIVLGWLRAKSVVFARGLYCTPILLLPIPMLHRVFELDPENAWQLPSKAAASPFGLEFVSRNLGQAVAMFFGFNHNMPVSVYLSFFGVIGCVLFLVLLLREARKPESMRADYVALSWISVGVLGLFGLLLAYFWDFDDVATRRLALPIIILMIFPGVAALGALAKSRHVLPAFIGLSIFMLFFEIGPRTAKDIYTQEYSPGLVANWKREFVKENREDYNLMIDVPGLWVTHQVPAITRDTALRNKEKLKFHLENKTFDNIYLVEIFTKDFASGVLRGGKNARLDKDFVLESVVDETFNGVVYTRISRVTDINVEVPEWIHEMFEEVDVSDYSRTELLAYQREQQRRLASLMPR